MSVDVLTETVIDRPVTVVAAYASDPSNAPQWYANIDRVAWESPPPLAVGSRLAFVARFLGRTLSYTYEIVSFEPDRLLVMRTGDGAGDEAGEHQGPHGAQEAARVPLSGSSCSDIATSRRYLEPTRSPHAERAPESPTR